MKFSILVNDLSADEVIDFMRNQNKKPDVKVAPAAPAAAMPAAPAAPAAAMPAAPAAPTAAMPAAPAAPTAAMPAAPAAGPRTLQDLLARIQTGFQRGQLTAEYIPTVVARINQNYGIEMGAITDVAGQQHLIDAAHIIMDQDGK